ncbi:MAG: PAS domain S-box protein [Desulfobacteraceae bacterium]|nr:PAS domain S-box protein [Desulfobacteraceae bacterium]
MPEKPVPETEAQPVRLAPSDYQDMLMNAPIGILSAAPDGRLIYANTALAQLFGYGSPQELIDSVRDTGERFYADAESSEKIKRLLAENREVLNQECRFVCRDGSVFWANYSVRTVRDNSGDIAHYQGFLSDITERKQERQSLLRTQFAMDRARDSILWVDDQGDIVYANDSACNSMGYTREELLEMKVFDIDPDFPPDQWEQHKAEVRRQGSMSFESRHRTKDGRLFPVEVSTNHFNFKDSYLACAFDRDITERKRTEAALKKSEARFRTLFKKAPMPMAHISLHGEILGVNDRLTETMGYTSDDAPTLRHARDLCFPDTDLRRQVTAKWRRELESAISGNSVMEPLEYPVHCKDGNQRFMVINTRLIGESIIVSFFDITQRKQAEAEREKLQGQLYQSQKLEAVGVLAGGVAHDFNNMLGSIVGNAELAIEETDPALAVRKNLDNILDAARRSTDLTRQLLAFARKQTIEPVVFDMNHSVEAILKMIRRLIGENIDLAWLPGQGPYTVRMDPSQFDQVLVNLCVNARDAIADVGRIAIETDSVSFDETYCKSRAEFIPGDYALLAVSDNGCGMDADTLNQIFDPFFTTKQPGQGTGMGLATVYGIVKQNQGFINAYSEHGKGTTFRIYIPLTSDDAAAATPQRPEGLRKSRGENILVVEDDPTLLEMTVMLLQRLGYSTISTGTPSEAIRAAEENSSEIHLVITDVVMPEMNGRELAGRIQTIRPKTKILFMSGYTANVIAHQGVLDRNINFIQKPFFLKDIAAKLREVLD